MVLEMTKYRTRLPLRMYKDLYEREQLFRDSRSRSLHEPKNVVNNVFHSNLSEIFVSILLSQLAYVLKNMQANVIPILTILSNITCVALKLAITLSPWP